MGEVNFTPLCRTDECDYKWREPSEDEDPTEHRELCLDMCSDMIPRLKEQLPDFDPTRECPYKVLDAHVIVGSELGYEGMARLDFSSFSDVRFIEGNNDAA